MFDTSFYLTISCTTLLFFIYFLVKFLYRKKDKYNLYFSIFCFFVSLHVFCYRFLSYPRLLLYISGTGLFLTIIILLFIILRKSIKECIGYESNSKEMMAIIKDSSKYAALLQKSILPSKETLKNLFADYYISFKPKGIVGGDFYWAYKKNNDFLVALIDCTGHGIDGALLTITVKSSIERIISEADSLDPATILKSLNMELKEVLSHDNGIDIGLCYYSNSSKTITFSGARIRLYIIDNGMLKEIKPDNKGIGYKNIKEEYTVKDYKVILSKDTAFYMTTDGFPDQSGGDYGYGFGWTKYKELLTENRNESMGIQLEKLEGALLEYQGGYDQMDDITLLGFKVRIWEGLND